MDLDFGNESDFLKAKIHGMRSYLIEGSKLTEYINNPSNEIIPDSQLPQNYKDASVTLRNETYLFKRDIFLLNNLRKRLTPRAGILIDFFFEDIFLENIRMLFRAWKRKDKAHALDYIIDVPGKVQLDAQEIVGSGIFKEFARSIGDALYTKFLVEASETCRPEEDNIFFETCLAKRHFNHFYSILEAGLISDNEELGKIMSVWLDIENVMITLRLREIYNSDWDVAKRMLFDHAGRVSSKNIERIYKLQGREAFIKALPGPYETFLLERVGADLDEVENFLRNYLYRFMNKHFYTSEDYLVKILCYIFFKKFETQNLISVLEGKKLGMEKEEIMEVLILPESA